MRRKVMLFVFAFILLFTGMLSMKAESITVVSEGPMRDSNDDPYLIPSDRSLDNEFAWAMLKTSDGKVAYCLDSGKEWPSSESMTTIDSSLSAGLLYILENGYPNKVIIDGGEKDRYITQGAVWFYQNNVLPTGVTDTYGLLPKMEELIVGARHASSAETGSLEGVDVASKDMSISIDKQYYVSSLITPKVSGVSNYSVSVSSGEAVDTNGNVKSSFSSSEGFYVRTSSNNPTDVNVTISIKSKGKILSSTNSHLQRIIYLSDEETDKSLSFKLSIKKDLVCVNYVIVGDVIPDPALTDPTPDESCYDKGTKYDQEKELTTRDGNCVFNGWYTGSDLKGKWVNGTALDQNLTLYGAWSCSTKVKVPPTPASTPLIVLGIGFASLAAFGLLYLYSKKNN